MGLALTLLATSFGCGSDKGGTDAGDRMSRRDGGGDDRDGGGGAGGSSDGGGAGGSSGKDGGDPLANIDANILDEDGGVEPCGQVLCVEPQCCADPFQSMCGVSAGRACLMPPPEGEEEDPRCPSFALSTFNFPSCCTEEGDCGVSVAMFGVGCLELSQFRMAAESMGAPPNIGIPDPQKCD
jgi:hypothetical protein